VRRCCPSVDIVAVDNVAVGTAAVDTGAIDTGAVVTAAGAAVGAVASTAGVSVAVPFARPVVTEAQTVLAVSPLGVTVSRFGEVSSFNKIISLTPVFSAGISDRCRLAAVFVLLVS
jgi:hypothetical protein